MLFVLCEVREKVNVHSTIDQQFQSHEDADSESGIRDDACDWFQVADGYIHNYNRQLIKESLSNIDPTHAPNSDPSPYQLTPYNSMDGNKPNSRSNPSSSSGSNQSLNQTQFLHDLSGLIPQSLSGRNKANMDGDRDGSESGSGSGVSGSNSSSSSINSNLTTSVNTAPYASTATTTIPSDQSITNPPNSLSKTLESKRITLLQTHIESLTNNMMVMNEQLEVTTRMLEELKSGVDGRKDEVADDA